MKADARGHARRVRAAGVGAVLLLAACGPVASPPEEPDMHPIDTSRRLVSDLAGTWYTGDPDALRAQLEGYLEEADETPPGRPSALVLPHAGYAYSGRIAAAGARALRGHRFRRVVVMGPAHRARLPHTAALPAAGSLETPLGDVPLDTAFIARLARHRGFALSPAAEGGEHSVGIQVPLLQVALGSFALVPIVVGRLDAPAARGLAGALLEEIDEETLVVASTDFTHYGRAFDYVPFEEDVEANLRRLDLGAFSRIEARDMEGFRAYVADTGATICGRDPVSILLAMLNPAQQVRLLAYDTSGRITGDWSRCVSYVAAAVTGAWKPAPKESEGAALELPLTGEDREALLALARGTLEGYLETGRRPEPRDLGLRLTAGMRQVAGAFVTLHEGGALRGCIGEIFPRRALCDVVRDHALNAALKDPRFAPVTRGELPELRIEISVLTPPVRVDSWREIAAGRHGMVLHKQGRSAVFLPQVAAEQGWDIETTLTHLARKAGLPPDAWKEGAGFEVFEAVVFGEPR